MNWTLTIYVIGTSHMFYKPWYCLLDPLCFQSILYRAECLQYVSMRNRVIARSQCQTYVRHAMCEMLSGILLQINAFRRSPLPCMVIFNRTYRKSVFIFTQFVLCDTVFARTSNRTIFSVYVHPKRKLKHYIPMDGNAAFTEWGAGFLYLLLAIHENV